MNPFPSQSQLARARKAPSMETAFCACGNRFIRRAVANPKQRKERCEDCVAIRRRQNEREAQRARRRYVSEKEPLRIMPLSRTAPCRGCPRFIPMGTTCPYCGDTNQSRLMA